MLSPLLYSLFTHDCVATHVSNSIIKFSDEQVVGLITNNDQTAYREKTLAEWCQDINLFLNVNKTKDLIVDFRSQQRVRPHPHRWVAVERVKIFKFLGVH